LQLSQAHKEPLDEEIQRLDGVDQLLRECQELLQSSSKDNVIDNQEFPEKKRLILLLHKPLLQNSQ